MITTTATRSARPIRTRTMLLPVLVTAVLLLLGVGLLGFGLGVGHAEDRSELLQVKYDLTGTVTLLSSDKTQIQVQVDRGGGGGLLSTDVLNPQVFGLRVGAYVHGTVVMVTGPEGSHEALVIREP